MLSVITCVAVLAAILVGPRLLVGLLAILIGASLFARSRSVTHCLLANGSNRQNLKYDRRPTRAERRLMKKSLRLALDQIELRSVFPTITASVERWSGPVR